MPSPTIPTNTQELIEFRKTPEYKNLTHFEKNKINAKFGGIAKGGTRLPRIVEKEKMQKALERKIQSKAFKLFNAGMTVAMGQVFVYRIDEEEDSKGKVISRKHVLVTDENEIAEALDEQEGYGRTTSGKYYYVTTKEPDHKAIQMLLDRGFGKPKETVDLNAHVTFSLRALAQKREMLKAEAEIINKEEPKQNA